MDNTSTPKKIVIVEDNVSLNDIYKTRLELIGYTCYAAYDGQTALDTIQRELPSLVLLDLMIPNIAGDEVLKRMRASVWGKDIKVYIISNLNEADAPAGLRNLGIEGYVVKANLSNDQLDKLVDNILKPSTQTEDVSLEMKEPSNIAEPTNSPPPTSQGNQPVSPVPVNQQVAQSVTPEPAQQAGQPAGTTPSSNPPTV